MLRRSPIRIEPGGSVLEEGVRVSAETSRRLACGASRVVMRHDEGGRPIEVGARTRTIPPALRRGGNNRGRGCCFSRWGGRFTQGGPLCPLAGGGPAAPFKLSAVCRRRL